MQLLYDFMFLLYLLCLHNEASLAHSNGSCPCYKLGTKLSTYFSTMEKCVKLLCPVTYSILSVNNLDACSPFSIIHDCHFFHISESRSDDSVFFRVQTCSLFH